MSATLELLDRYKAAQGISSDNAAALSLGLKRQTVSGWRKLGKQAEPHVVARMAHAVGDDPLRWLALVESERAHSEADRRTWVEVARRFGAIASVAAVALLVGGIAADRPALGSEHILGIMRSAAWAALAVLAAHALHARRSLTITEAPHGPSAMLA